MTKFKNDFKAPHRGSFTFMPGYTERAGWQRPGPVFEEESGTGGGGGNDDTVAAATAAREAAEAAKKTAEDNAAKLLKEVMGLKNKAKEDAAKFARFDGIDPDTVKAMLAEREEQATKAREAEEKRLRDAGDFDKLKKQMADEHERELKAERDRSAAEAAKISAAQKTIEELTIGAAFANSSFLRDETLMTPTKARKVYGDYFETENGVIKAYDKERGEDNRNPLVNASGNPLSFEDAMRRIIENDPEKDRLLKSKEKSGSAQMGGGKNNTGKTDGEKHPAAGVNRIVAGLAGLKAGT